MMVVKKKACRHRHVPVRAMLVATIVPAGLTAQVSRGSAVQPRGGNCDVPCVHSQGSPSLG
jgi:hypothetical protein